MGRQTARLGYTGFMRIENVTDFQNGNNGNKNEQNEQRTGGGPHLGCCAPKCASQCEAAMSHRRRRIAMSHLPATVMFA